MTIEHGAIMEILATPSSSSSRSPSISWQACQNATCLCLCALRFWVGLLEMWSLQQASQKKKTFLCLDGCCHHSNEIDANVAGWIFLFNATAEHFRIRHPFSRWVVTHSKAADFDFHEPRTVLSKMNQHPLWYLMSVQLKHLRPNVRLLFFVWDCPQWRYIKWRNPHL